MITLMADSLSMGGLVRMEMGSDMGHLMSLRQARGNRVDGDLSDFLGHRYQTTKDSESLGGVVEIRWTESKDTEGGGEVGKWMKKRKLPNRRVLAL